MSTLNSIVRKVPGHILANVYDTTRVTIFVSVCIKNVPPTLPVWPLYAPVPLVCSEMYSPRVLCPDIVVPLLLLIRGVLNIWIFSLL